MCQHIFRQLFKLLFVVIRNEHGCEIPMQLNSSSSQRFAITHKEPIGVVVAERMAELVGQLQFGDPLLATTEVGAVNPPL